MGATPGTSPLVATGFSICGASAVAAMDGVSRNKEDEVVTAIVQVTSLAAWRSVLPWLQHPSGCRTSSSASGPGPACMTWPRPWQRLLSPARRPGLRDCRQAHVVVPSALIVAGVSLWRRDERGRLAGVVICRSCCTAGGTIHVSLEHSLKQDAMLYLVALVRKMLQYLSLSSAPLLHQTYREVAGRPQHKGSRSSMMDSTSESLRTFRRDGLPGPLALLGAVAVAVGLTTWLAGPARRSRTSTRGRQALIAYLRDHLSGSDVAVRVVHRLARLIGVPPTVRCSSGWRKNSKRIAPSSALC